MVEKWKKVYFQVENKMSITRRGFKVSILQRIEEKQVEEEFLDYHVTFHEECSRHDNSLRKIIIYYLHTAWLILELVKILFDMV